jgi:WD40 repeat protein
MGYASAMENPASKLLLTDSDTESMTFSADGARLITSHPVTRLVAWDTASGGISWSRSHAHHLTPIVYLPDGSILANQMGRGPCILSGETGEELRAFAWGNAIGFTLMGVSEDGQLCAVSDEAGHVRFIHLPEGQIEPRGKLVPGTPEHPAFDRDGRWIVFAMQMGTPIFVFDRAADKIIGLLVEWSKDRGWRVAFLPDGRLVGVSGQEVAVWSADLTHRTNLPDAPADVSGLRVHPAGRYFFTWGYDHAVRVWDVDNGSQRVLIDTTDVTNPAIAAIDPTGRWFALGCFDKTLRLFDLVS